MTAQALSPSLTLQSCMLIPSTRARVASAEAGQCVSFALKRVRRTDVRKGMVLVHKADAPPKGMT